MTITLKEKMATFSPEYREEIYSFARELAAREHLPKESGKESNETDAPAKGDGSVVPAKGNEHFREPIVE